MGYTHRIFLAAASLIGTYAVANAAVVPTRTDQIGVDPVTVYPIDHIVQHTLPPDPNAPTVTVITTMSGSPTPTPVTTTKEVFFSVSANAAGDVAVNVANTKLGDFLKSIFSEAACGLPGKKVRRALENRQQVCNMPRPPRPLGPDAIKKIKGWDKTTKMIQNLYEEMLEKTEQNKATADVKSVLREFYKNNPDWAGAEQADVVAETGFDLSIGADEAGLTALEAEGEVAGELGTLGMSVIGMLYRLYQEEIIDGVAVGAIAVKGATVVNSLIKTVSTTRRTRTSTTTAGSCPTSTDAVLPQCGSKECEKTKGKTKQVLFIPIKEPGEVCDGGPHDGCDCSPSILQLISFPDNKLQTIFDLTHDSLPKEMPVFPPVTGNADCSADKEGLEKKLFKRLASDFCSTWTTFRLDHDVDRSYQASTVSWSGYNGWEFKFGWKNSDKKCENTCEQIFINGFGDNSDCAPEDKKVSKHGSRTLECGKASFEIKNPDNVPKAECSNDESPVYKATVGGPNASKSTLYGDFCNRLKSGEIISTLGMDADGYEFILSTTSHAGTECRENDCDKAFGSMMEKCGKKGQNADMLSTKGWFNAGCIVYGYEVGKKKDQPSTPPPSNPPPDKTICNKDSDCGKWTCDGSKKAFCSSTKSGDPLTKYCSC